MTLKERAERAIELIREAKDCLAGSGGYAPVYTPGQKDELYKENGEKAGMYDLCEWWVQTYPDDIFINDPPLVTEIRDRMKLLLAGRKE